MELPRVRLTLFPPGGVGRALASCHSLTDTSSRGCSSRSVDRSATRSRRDSHTSSASRSLRHSRHPRSDAGVSPSPAIAPATVVPTSLRTTRARGCAARSASTPKPGGTIRKGTARAWLPLPSRRTTDPRGEADRGHRPPQPESPPPSSTGVSGTGAPTTHARRSRTRSGGRTRSKQTAATTSRPARSSRPTAALWCVSGARGPVRGRRSCGGDHPGQ